MSVLDVSALQLRATARAFGASWRRNRLRTLFALSFSLALAQVLAFAVYWAIQNKMLEELLRSFNEVGVAPAIGVAIVGFVAMGRWLLRYLEDSVTQRHKKRRTR